MERRSQTQRSTASSNSLAGIHIVGDGQRPHPAAAGTIDRLVAHADAALYEAKRAGKNRLAVYEP